MRELKKIVTILCVLLMLFSNVFNSFSNVNAYELGKINDLKESKSWNKVIDLLNVPKVWTGEYHGNYGYIEVWRKYCLKITKIDGQTGDFKGVCYVDKGKDHPNEQVRAIYNCDGNIDLKNNSINWQGTSFILNPGNFDLVKFSAEFGDDYRYLSGTTTAFSGSTVKLNNLKFSDINAYIGIDTDNFAYDNTEQNFDLANECMELNLLAFGEAVYDGNGYYIGIANTKENKKITTKQLKNKLKNEGFKYHGMKISPNDSYKNTDCIRWHRADKPLKDGSTLVYIVCNGTTKNEWNGNFNVYSEDMSEKNSSKHYSFQKAADAVTEEIENTYGNNTKIVVTGHSRGAAVANLVAKALSDNSMYKVYAYTFATPNCISKKEAFCNPYNNIFNYLFDDDFVTYMPLADANWQYGRYGTTYTAVAADLYTNSKYSIFRSVMNHYGYHNANQGNIGYKKRGAITIANYLTQSCSSVDEFYNMNKPILSISDGQIIRDASWYEYFHDFFANLLGGKRENSWPFRYILGNPDFRRVTELYVVGGAGYAGFIVNENQHYADVCSYLGITHDPASYYALTQLLKYDSYAETALVPYNESELRSELEDKYKEKKSLTTISNKLAASVKYLKGLNVNYDEDQVNTLKKFANSNENNSVLEWDLNDPSSWSQVVWNSSGAVTSIDFIGLGLSEKLDLSKFTSLDYLDITNNDITDLILPNVEKMDVYCDGNYLDIYSNCNLVQKLTKYQNNGSIVSFSKQKIRESAEFDSNELNKLKSFADLDNNQVLLGWNLDDPRSFAGIDWELINGTYHVCNVSLGDLGVTGVFDCSGFGFVNSIDLYDNNLSSVDVSGCDSLIYLNVCNNKLTSLIISNTQKLEMCICHNNYLVDNMSDEIRNILTPDNKIIAEVFPQFTEATYDDFDKNEIKALKSYISDKVDDIDWSYPGTNEYLQWIKEDGKYHLYGINMEDTDISGDLDFTDFKELTRVNFRNTSINSITLPSSVEKLDDYSFANCKYLNDFIVTDSLDTFGTDVFYESPNIVITCTSDSFAKVIAEALDIPFKDIVALTYIEVVGEEKGYYLQGEDFDLNGKELKLYYSDGSSKYITDGFDVKGYDSEKMGKQTVTIIYSEGNYNKKTTLDIFVYGHTEDGVVYKFKDSNEDSYSICGYAGDKPDVVIPSEINGLKAYDIVYEAFNNNDVVKTVVISEGIEQISEYAFNGCKKLESVVLPDSLKYLSGRVFRECESLKECTLPESITTIPEGMFYRCGSLTSVKSKGVIENVGYYAFEECSLLKDLAFLENAKKIDSEAFKGCSSIEEVIIPDSVDEIYYNVFENCTSLKKVRLNNNFDYIPDGMFSGCSQLIDIEIPDKVTRVGCCSFYKCSSLETIKLPDTLKSIDSSAFYGCKKLKNVVFPETLELIDHSAFGDCDSLTEVIIPNSVTEIRSEAFSYCSSLVKVKLSNKIEYIAPGLFKYCTKLNEVNIPDTINAIYFDAFYNCSSITKLTLPITLKEIGVDAFEETKMTEIVYPGTSKQFYELDIAGWGNDILFDKSVMKFLGDPETKENPDTKDKSETKDNPESKVPGSNDNYKDAGEGIGRISSDGKTLIDTNGNQFSVLDKMNNGDIRKNIGVADKKTGGKYKITNVTFVKKNGKKVIKSGVVSYVGPYDNTKASIKIPDSIKINGIKFSVTVISNNAFLGAKNLSSVTIGKNVTQVGKKAFYNCIKLKKVTIKTKKLKKIGSKAFKGINSKAKFKVPKKKLKKYKKMIKKAGAPKKAKITK